METVVNSFITTQLVEASTGITASIHTNHNSIKTTGGKKAATKLKSRTKSCCVRNLVGTRRILEAFLPETLFQVIVYKFCKYFDNLNETGTKMDDHGYISDGLKTSNRWNKCEKLYTLVFRYHSTNQCRALLTEERSADIIGD